MSLLDLPPELVQAILDHIRDDKKLLYALSITCRSLNPHANRLLYSRVRIRYHPDVFRFSRTMLDNPCLASFVTSFTGSLFHVRLSKEFEPLEGWLQNIVNLRYLHLTPCPKRQFRLESLEVCYYAASRLFKQDLMQEHPDFVHISDYIFGLLKAWPLSPLAFPDLKVLRGSIYAASAVLPGRKVVRFEWDYLYDELDRVPAVTSNMSDQLDNLRSLSFRVDNAETFNTFRALPNLSLKSLRFLEIQKMHEQDWSFIPNLPSLRVLLVLESNRNLNSMLNHPQRVIELFFKCRTLRRVDVGGKFHVTRGCHRWLRGVELPIVIPRSVAENGRTEFLDDADRAEDD